MADTPSSNSGATATGLPTSDLNPQTNADSGATGTSTGTPGDVAKAASIINNPNAAPAAKAQAAKMLKSLRIKVDGQEFDEKLPFELDESNKEAVEYMKRQLQFSKAAQKRMGEKAQIENEVRSFFEQLKSNPRKILADPAIGIDLKKLAAQMIEEEIANSQKSPDQLAKEKLQAELQEERDARKREKEENDKREFERIQETEYERYDTLMTQALEKSDLPKSPYVVKKMADYMMLGLQNNMDVNPEDVLPLVREEILEDIRQMSQAMPLETLEKLFGGDILTKIRKGNVAKAKSKTQPSSPKLPDVGATRAEPKKALDDSKKVTFKKFFGV
jgi:hypothetical protein